MYLLLTRPNKNNCANVLQEELKDGETIAVKMIGCDGNITQTKLGEGRVQLSGVRQNHTSFNVIFIPLNLNKSEQSSCLSLCTPVRPKTGLFSQ